MFSVALVPVDPTLWSANWAWSLPLIVMTVVIHVLGLGYINHRITRVSIRNMKRYHPVALFIVIMGTTTLAATVLHGLEASIWAAAFRLHSVFSALRLTIAPRYSIRWMP